MGCEGKNGPISPDPDALDAGLKEAFEAQAVEWVEGVLGAIESRAGFESRVLLRDVAEEPAPVLKLRPRDDVERAEDSKRYEIIGEIARGGVGVIFKGRDKDLGREVATKILRREFVENAAIVQRFLEEAQIGGQLQNPGIVPVYDLGLQADGRPYFVMKLVKGRTLSALLDEREDPSAGRRRFLAIFEQICQTMAYAHARGVIHRDLKSANVMIGAFGEMQLVDWGFAKVLGLDRDGDAPPPDLSVIATLRTGDDGSQSVAGSIMGTPAYMPPEQALGQIDQLDERSDVFGLGAILCEILTGKPAYVGEPDDVLIMAAQARLEGAHARLDACAADPELVVLVKRCLSPEKAGRPANAEVLAKSIGDHLASMEERARRAEVVAAEQRARGQEEHRALLRERTRAKWEQRARRRTLVLAASVLAAVLLAGGGYLWFDQEHQDRTARVAESVRRSMQEATLLGAQEQWTEALGAAGTADELAQGADANTRDEAAALLAELSAGKQRADEAAEQAARNRKVLTRYDARLARSGRNPQPDVEKIYVKAFDDYGVDVAGSSADAIAAHLKDRAVAVELALVFNDWAARKGEHSEKVARIALAIDDDPWRTRLRRAVQSRDAKQVVSMAAKAGEQPVESLVLLGQSLLSLEEREAAIEVLERAHERFLTDYRIVALLGEAFRMITPPRWKECARALTAAATLRPESTHLHLNLGYALAFSGNVVGAVPCMEEVNRRAKGSEGILLELKRLEKLSTYVDRMVAGEIEATSRDVVDLPRLLFYRQRFVASAEAYRRPIREKLCDTFFAGCAAAIAGAGAGRDAGALDDEQRARLREQSRQWMREALAHKQRLIGGEIEEKRDDNIRALRAWKGVWYLYPVRETEWVERLPEDEQRFWREFWTDVDATLEEEH